MKVFNFSSVIEILTDIEKKILLFCNISLINKKLFIKSNNFLYCRNYYNNLI